MNCITVLLLLAYALTSHAAGSSNLDRCRCMNKIILLHRKDDYRTVFSPEFPRPYCGNMDCKWRIVAPDNTSQIEFTAKNIDLREGRDFVHFYDTHIEDGWIARKAAHSCSGTGPCEFVSAGRYATIRFVTQDGEPDRYGFQGSVRVRRTGEWLSSAWNIAIVVFLVACAVVVALVAAYLIRIRRRARDQDPLLAKLQAKTQEERVKHAITPSNKPIVYNVLQ